MAGDPSGERPSTRSTFPWVREGGRWWVAVKGVRGFELK